MRLNAVILFIAIFLGFATTLWMDSHSVPISVPFDPMIQASPQRGKEVPVFAVTNLAGETHKFSEYKGRFVIIHFWATWCAPCVIEFPKLIAFAKAHRQIQVIALSSDGTDTAIKHFLKKQSIVPPNMMVAHDSHQKITADLFQTFKLPESIIVDAQGLMVTKFIGDVDWSSPEIAHFFP